MKVAHVKRREDLFQNVNHTFKGISSDKVRKEYLKWMERSERVINANGGYV
jgi:hypothetical protein